MRVLLIDNYDSYTYNLYQLLARVHGKEPTVLVNDDPSWPDVDLSAFDCLVISPGPGRPQRASDLGWCRRVLDEHDELPILGVCLGHQAIAHHHGATVERGRPRHGHLTRVRHRGQNLFDGLPQDFVAVRYHSLRVAEPLPEELEAIAWAEDGTVMALRHRHLPRWGVQFHPESIATEWGAHLLRNFAVLTGHSHVAAAPSGHTSWPAHRPHTGDAGDSGPGLRLVVEVVDRPVDTAALFSALFGGSASCFWLDSSEVDSRRARFSFLGDAGGPLAETLTYRVGTDVVEVRDAHGRRTERGSIFDVLRQRLRDRALSTPELPFDLNGGYVGYFGYEMKAECGSPNTHVAPTPDAVWMFADRLVVVDHEEHRVYVVAVCREHERGQARDWVDETVSRVRSLADAPPEPGPVVPAVSAASAPAVFSRSRAEYVSDIGECLDELRQGESYEICLTNRVTLPPLRDPLRYHLVLRRLNPAPYGAFLRWGETSVVCSSPERFLRIDRDGVVESKPIKGTAPRSSDPETDEELRRTLAASAKTRAENLMIVDLLRNDLGRVCEVGSVEVPSYMATETYATVHQLVSTVRGRLRSDVDAVSCVRACFPGGSMTGAPKLRTMGIIDRLERGPRGIYSGTIGYFGLSGGADLNIVIRTAVATASQTVIGTGGAIVLDSDPDEEFDEVVLKGQALLRAYDIVGADGEQPRESTQIPHGNHAQGRRHGRVL
ncbi:para-aminobenzoate synthetase [Streptoalloteichus tenebrarius]|uniref:aminodeoxychorismate synthase n=1 Tax=Streptoalloteichus tenebrarius (strain ATCC 17920 / DSM 40477 / JCM 4838 / CBS 697.72 / NBRC 16177 / NCIMB 11028 / NRRL B-12390 / A12253. 1 / ISP 5477) TaxID=1933 RepID=A0ABT1HTZ4_STRSD|nr:aminodeoxychorismate synthase component I [Streptoalloteichus tenebrarius]MCP2258875.1 para-aminobenzoate synthetase [Streptoalloteichus tenebrarius]BFE99441.1 aminodeoxychorismate synthase component I [Streptoalloteichus tenebrarius]